MQKQKRTSQERRLKCTNDGRCQAERDGKRNIIKTKQTNKKAYTGTRKQSINATRKATKTKLQNIPQMRCRKCNAYLKKRKRNPLLKHTMYNKGECNNLTTNKVEKIKSGPTTRTHTRYVHAASGRWQTWARAKQTLCVKVQPLLPERSLQQMRRKRLCTKRKIRCPGPSSLSLRICAPQESNKS